MNGTGAHLLISMCKHTEMQLCPFLSHFFRYKDISRALNRSSPDQTSSCPYKYIIVQTEIKVRVISPHIYQNFCISEVQGNWKFLINEKVNIRGEKVNTVLVSMRHTFASFKTFFLVSVLMTLEISSACKSSSQLLF